MEYEVVTTFITSVGFPIAMCLLLFWYVKEQNATHKEEVDKLRSAIDNNTLILQRLTTILDRKGGE